MNKAVAFLKTTWNRFLDLVYPSGLTCVNCGAELVAETRYNLCASCTEKLPNLAEHRCKICGCEILNEADYCNNCQRFDHFFEANRAPLKYEGIATDLVKKLKFGNKQYIATELGKLMADEYLLANYNCDIITFVPMSDKEKKERGFNQSELLAREVSKRLNLPLSSALKKVKETDTQKQLTAKERRENLKEVFGIFDKSEVKGKIVLLIDDVFTTGATVNECSRILKKAGARQIYSLTACITQFKLEGEVQN